MRVVFDLEADGWRDVATRVWCIAIKEEGYDVRVYGPDDIGVAMRIMELADELVGHNIINYDLPILKRLYWWRPRDSCKITDTVILSRLYKSDRILPVGCAGNVARHSLEAWGHRVGRGKPGHDDWTKFTPEMAHRCGEDAEINELVYQELRNERGNEVDWTDSEITEHTTSGHITEQEITGVPLDVTRTRKYLGQVEQEVQSIDETVVHLIPEVPLPKSKQSTWPKKQFKKDGTPTVQALKYYGESFSEYRTDIVVKTAPINLASAKQVKDYLLSIAWVPTEWNYKKDPNTGKPVRDMTGQKVRTSPKLTLDSLESCDWPEGHADMGEGITKRLMYAHRRGMLEGWLRDVRPDGRISAEAIPMGTPTGRMVHRKVVNVPGKEAPLGPELRSCFTTVPGYKRVGIDLRSCQIYALAHYMHDEGYRTAVLEGDSHAYVQELANLSTRSKGKKLHYTILFGGGDEKVATDLRIAKVEARLVKKKLFANLPALPKLIDQLKKEWKTKGYITGLDGRVIWVRAEHMLVVYAMQSLEAIVMKNFINRLFKITWNKGLIFEMVTVMHDEAQFLVKEGQPFLKGDSVDYFKVLAYEAIEFVNDKFNLWCPQAIDIKVGNTWSDCH